MAYLKINSIAIEVLKPCFESEVQLCWLEVPHSLQEKSLAISFSAKGLEKK